MQFPWLIGFGWAKRIKWRRLISLPDNNTQNTWVYQWSIRPWPSLSKAYYWPFKLKAISNFFFEILDVFENLSHAPKTLHTPLHGLTMTWLGPWLWDFQLCIHNYESHYKLKLKFKYINSFAYRYQIMAFLAFPLVSQIRGNDLYRDYQDHRNDALIRLNNNV